MKRKKLFLVYSCILLTCLILISCTAPIPMAETPFVVTPSQVLTTATPGIASVQVTLASSTVVPTLPVNQANSRLLELLANNGNCQLPCIWGITPGESTFGDAQDILIPLSSISTFTALSTSPGDISPTYVEGDNRVSARIAFPFSATGVIRHVVFQMGITSASDEFSKQIEYYMLPNILTEYGNPTTVMLSTMAKLPSSGVPGGFKLLLLYPEKGILVNYTMQMQITAENVMGCPSNAHHVELGLYPSGQADSFFDLLEPSGWPQIIQKTYKPIDEATSMSQEDFYRTFSQHTDKCILTPANLWPVPN